MSDTETPLLRTKDDVCEYLKDYAGLNFRMSSYFRRGLIKFETGNDVWPESWYSKNAWENRSWPLVFELIEAMYGVNNFKLYYDRANDFHHIEFDLLGERYDVQWYKVYSVTRMRDGAKTTLYYHVHNVTEFFTSGNYLEMKVY